MLNLDLSLTFELNTPPPLTPLLPPIGPIDRTDPTETAEEIEEAEEVEEVEEVDEDRSRVKKARGVPSGVNAHDGS
ncbi:hypothetical protein HK102_007135, partial [Quaeritorhiza haematococci]